MPRSIIDTQEGSRAGRTEEETFNSTFSSAPHLETQSQCKMHWKSWTSKLLFFSSSHRREFQPSYIRLICILVFISTNKLPLVWISKIILEKGSQNAVQYSVLLPRCTFFFFHFFKKKRKEEEFNLAA